jgi:hypothetical protein
MKIQLWRHGPIREDNTERYLTNIGCGDAVHMGLTWDNVQLLAFLSIDAESSAAKPTGGFLKN